MNIESDVGIVHIRKTAGHYYVDIPGWTCDSLGNPIIDPDHDPKSLQVYLKLDLPGCENPFASYFRITIKDYKDRRLEVICDIQNRVEIIRYKDDKTKTPVDDVMLPASHGLFDLIHRVPVGQNPY